MNPEWRNISVTLHCSQRLRSEAIRLSVPQHRIIDMACADILELELTTTAPGDVAREMFRLARPEVPR